MNRIPKYSIAILKKYLTKHYWYIPSQYGNITFTFGFSWYFTKKEKNDSENKNNNKNLINNLINEADQLFEAEKYMETYNLLSAYNINENIEIDWRICRVLYKMSRTEFYNKDTKRAMILEAYDIIKKAIILNESNAEIHKWTAILLDAKLRYESKFSKIEDNIRIKNHLMEANKLNPNDFTVLYMLGQWHYKLCTLRWFQKKIAAILYPELPNCNYEDALNYFLKAEQLKPRFYLSNIYMLGKLNYQMGNVIRAHYYLTIAAQMTPSTYQEEQCVNMARNLATKLKNYDVIEDAL